MACHQTYKLLSIYPSPFFSALTFHNLTPHSWHCSRHSTPRYHTSRWHGRTLCQLESIQASASSPHPSSHWESCWVPWKKGRVFPRIRKPVGEYVPYRLDGMGSFESSSSNNHPFSGAHWLLVSGKAYGILRKGHTIPETNNLSLAGSKKGPIDFSICEVNIWYPKVTTILVCWNPIWLKHVTWL